MDESCLRFQTIKEVFSLSSTWRLHALGETLRAKDKAIDFSSIL